MDNYRRRYGYQEPPQINPNLVDFGQLPMYNPQDTERLAQIGQQAQQRYDTSQATIAKYLEDVSAADFSGLDQGIRDRLMLELDTNAARIQDRVSKDYQGDYGRALPEILKGLSRDRGLMHQGIQESAKAKQAFAEYQDSAKRGLAPQKYIPGQGLVTMSFEDYHKQSGRLPGFTEEGKFVGGQYAPLRGASDLSGYLRENVSAALNAQSVEGGLNPSKNALGFLVQSIKEGMSDPEIYNMFFNKEGQLTTYGKQLAGQLKGEVNFLQDEFDGQSDEELVKYATPIIQGQVTERLKYDYKQDPNYTSPGGGNEDPLTRLRNLPTKTTTKGDVVTTAKELGYSPKDVFAKAEVGDPIAIELKTKAEEIVIANNPIYQNLPERPVITTGLESLGIKDQALIQDLQNIWDAQQQFNQNNGFFTRNFNSPDFWRQEQQVIDKYLDNQNLSFREKNALGKKIYNSLRSAVKDYKEIHNSFQKDVKNELLDVGISSTKIGGKIGTDFNNNLINYMDTYDFTTEFVTSSGDQLSENEAKKLTKDKVKAINILQSTDKLPVRFEFVKKDNSTVTLQLHKSDETSKEIMTHISFEAQDPTILENYYNNLYLKGLSTTTPVKIGNTQIIKVSSEDIENKINRGEITNTSNIQMGGDYYYAVVNNEGKVITPMFNNTNDVLNAALYITGVDTPPLLQYGTYVANQATATKAQVQKTYDSINSHLESLFLR
jgi:hypothetical protein